MLLRGRGTGMQDCRAARLPGSKAMGLRGCRTAEPRGFRVLG